MVGVAAAEPPCHCSEAATRESPKPTLGRSRPTARVVHRRPHRTAPASSTTTGRTTTPANHPDPRPHRPPGAPPTGRVSASWTVQAISTILDNSALPRLRVRELFQRLPLPGLPPEAYQILVRSDRPAHPALVAI